MNIEPKNDQNKMIKKREHKRDEKNLKKINDELNVLQG